MAATAVTDSAKSLEAILHDYENRTHSHFVLKYSDKKFFEDGKICNSVCVVYIFLYFGKFVMSMLYCAVCFGRSGRVTVGHRALFETDWFRL